MKLWIKYCLEEQAAPSEEVMDTTEAEPAAAIYENPVAPETTTAETPAVSEEATKPEGEAAVKTTAWLFLLFIS